nr:glycosyltransferase family 39 protein [Lachnospiraceae bacterium]
MDKRSPDTSTKIILTVVSCIAVFLRAFYIYYTPSWIRQHDVVGFGTGDGQAAFIEYFYDGHLLLDFDPRGIWGFFQPPLHHMLSALWIHLQEFAGIAYDSACENVQIIVFIYGVITLIFSYLILKYFDLEGVPLIISFAIAAVHPGFILMSGSVNNDMLAIMFSVITIWLGLKWNDHPGWGYTIALAFTIGLGMMTKLFAALVAPAIAVLFLVKWVKAGKTGILSYFIKYAVFLFICAPLGLWSPVRNLIKFGVPVSFTPEVGEPVKASLIRRIFDIRTGKPFVYMEKYGDPYNEFNIFLGMMKSSLFGDQDFAIAMTEAGRGGTGAFMITAAGWILLISGAVLAVICFFATLRVLCTGSYISDGVVRAYLAAIYLVSVIAYVRFMFTSMSYSSMDFRYVLYLIPIEALM